MAIMAPSGGPLKTDGLQGKNPAGSMIHALWGPGWTRLPEGYPRVNSEEGASSDRTLAQSSHLSPARVALLWPGAKAVHAGSPTQVTCAEQDASGRDHSTRRA